MAAFSYHQPAFLPDTTFLHDEFVPNFQQFYSSFGTCENQTPLTHNNNNHEGSSFDTSAHESSCVEQQSIHNENSLSEKQRNDSLSMVDKAQSGDQVTQNCVPVDKKRKSRNGSSLNSANSKDTKQVKSKKQKANKEAMNDEKNDKKDKNKVSEEPPKDYIHVRARRGQATDSHSLAERVRREKISEKMKTLQAIVPGCDKVTGKALMLDEIINYVQSLQNQVEFLSLKLATVDPMVYTFGLMDLDPMVFGADVQGMNNNNIGLPIPLMQSINGNTSGSSSPTQAFPNVNSCLASPATSSTLSPTFNNLHVSNVSNNLLQHEQKPNFLHFQDVGSSYWGVNEHERQSIINQFGLLIGNNLYSSQ